MVISFFARLFLLLSLSNLSGCVYGIIYTDTTEPLVEDMNNTQIVEAAKTGSSTTLKDPITLAGLRVEWSTFGIGDVGKNAGFKNVKYADFQNQSYAAGIFRQRKIWVYGEK